MSTDAVAEIKARLDILDVIGTHVSLHRSGTQHTGLCPFHPEKTPSFVVSQPKQSWYCHGCHEGGDVITFVEKIERVDFPRALEILAERAGVELERSPQAAARGAGRRRSLGLNDRAARFYEYVLWSRPEGEPGRRLLAERGVVEALARRFRVGFAPSGGQAGSAVVRYLVDRGGATLPEVSDAGLASRSGRDLFRHRLVFPISDERGQVLGFGGRALGDAMPKYLNTPETGVYHKSSALFGLDQAGPALRQRRVAVVVEGYFDVLAAHLAGVAHVVASSGTVLTREQVRIIARHADEVVLCFDGDSAGRRAADTAVDLCTAEKLAARIAVLPSQFKDPDEMVRVDPAGFAATISGAEREWHILLQWTAAGVGAGVDERRGASERVAALLRRIPDEGTRELYAREAAQMLEVSAASLVASALTEERAASLIRARPAGGRTTTPPSASPPRAAIPGGAPDAGSLEDEDAGHPPPSWEEFLAAYAVQRPALARVMVDDLGLALDDLASPPVRRVLEAALAAPAGTDLALHALRLGDRRLAARLSVRDLPELADTDPVALERAMVDCIRQVRRAASRDRARREIRDLLSVPAAPGGDRDESVAARLRQLLAEEQEPPS